MMLASRRNQDYIRGQVLTYLQAVPAPDSRGFFILVFLGRVSGYRKVPVSSCRRCEHPAALIGVLNSQKVQGGIPMPNTHLVPVAGTAIPAIIINDQPHVALKPICDQLGLSWGSQYNRIRRNAVLKSCIFITKTEGKRQSYLPINYLNGWLFGIAVNRVRPRIRKKLIQYQRECFDALFQYFYHEKPEPKKSPEQESRTTLTIMKSFAEGIPLEGISNRLADQVQREILLIDLVREREAN